MGRKLVKYYEIAKQKGGLSGQIKLAMKTTISQPRAAEILDSPALVQKFYAALIEIFGADPSIPKP